MKCWSRYSLTPCILSGLWCLMSYSGVYVCTFHLQISQANTFHNIWMKSKYAAHACEWGLNWKRAQRLRTQTHTTTFLKFFSSHPLSSHQRCLMRRPADQLAVALQDCGWWRQSDVDVEMKAGGERHSVYPTWKSMEDNLAQHFVLFFFFLESLPLRAKSWLEAVGYFSQDVRLCAFICVCACALCVWLQ